ncbi:MAG: hypothetical protein ACI9VT_004111 [Psychroserpens sp.]|jgi:hypothetical protein
MAHIANTYPCGVHIVKREDLDKALRFLKGLIQATEKIVVTRKL